MEKFKKETDFYTREWNPLKPADGQTITFKHKPHVYVAPASDWYMIVALEKAEKVTTDRHLLTSELLLSYRWAIREGYNHTLDPALKNRWDYPRNQNTIKGIQGYIERIKKLSEKEYEN